MPPKYYVTFVNKHNDTEITIVVYCSKIDLARKVLERLNDTVKYPLDYKIKTK